MEEGLDDVPDMGLRRSWIPLEGLLDIAPERLGLNPDQQMGQEPRQQRRPPPHVAVSSESAFEPAARRSLGSSP